MGRRKCARELDYLEREWLVFRPDKLSGVRPECLKRFNSPFTETREIKRGRNAQNGGDCFERWFVY